MMRMERMIISILVGSEESKGEREGCLIENGIGDDDDWNSGLETAPRGGGGGVAGEGQRKGKSTGRVGRGRGQRGQRAALVNSTRGRRVQVGLGLQLVRFPPKVMVCTYVVRFT